MIPFNLAIFSDIERENMNLAMKNRYFGGDGQFTKLVHQWFDSRLDCSCALLTTSCTHSLEMAAILADIKPGDEVILPSYTFVSTANAFVLRGATPVFVDIRPDTQNIDETLIEDAITEKTRAIAPVHYAGVACEMDTIMEIADRHNLVVIEDAAQGVMSTYKGRDLGTIGHFGTYSFHETKNYSCGEGGLTIVKDEEAGKRAEIIREKGTNRSQFFRGMVDKYSWVDVGSSYLPSEFNAAYLYGQLLRAEEINENRLATWKSYYTGLSDLKENGRLELPYIPEECEHNAHMFYIKLADLDERTRLITHLKELDIQAYFHYVPLHSSAAGSRFGRFHGTDTYTTKESERLLRLPMWYGLSDEQIDQVITGVQGFFK